MTHLIDCFFIGLDAFWHAFTWDESKEELQDLLSALHESVQREDLRHRFDLRRDVLDWEAHGGREAWDRFVEHHRTHPMEACHDAR